MENRVLPVGTNTFKELQAASFMGSKVIAIYTSVKRKGI